MAAGANSSSSQSKIRHRSSDELKQGQAGLPHGARLLRRIQRKQLVDPSRLRLGCTARHTCASAGSPTCAFACTYVRFQGLLGSWRSKFSGPASVSSVLGQCCASARAADRGHHPVWEDPTPLGIHAPGCRSESVSNSPRSCSRHSASTCWPTSAPGLAHICAEGTDRPDSARRRWRTRRTGAGPQRPISAPLGDHSLRQREREAAARADGRCERLPAAPRDMASRDGLTVQSAGSYLDCGDERGDQRRLVRLIAWHALVLRLAGGLEPYAWPRHRR